MLISQVSESKPVNNNYAFSIPEKLWSSSGRSLAQNIIVKRLPNEKGSITAGIYKQTESDTVESVIIGEICDIVKGYDGSSFQIGKGTFVIKPPEGSSETPVKVLSNGLVFVYRAGKGLEYSSGEGTITIKGVSTNLPIDPWKSAQKDNTIFAYEEFIRHNPDSPKLSEARENLETLMFNKCIKDDSYSQYKAFQLEFPKSKQKTVIDKKIMSFKKKSFMADTIISYKELKSVYNFNGISILQPVGGKSSNMEMLESGDIRHTGDFGFGNIEFYNSNVIMAKAGFKIGKGSVMVYKAPSVKK